MKIRDVLDDLGVRYATEGRNTRPGWLQLTCPQCKGVDYLGINTFGNYANCWRCGRLDLTQAIALLANCSPVAARQACRGLSRELAAARPKTGRLVLPSGLGPLLPAHKRYLEGRGFDVTALKRLWGIQGIGIATRLQWRTFIPVYYRGRMVSWTTRAIADTNARYISAAPNEEEVHHKDILYGADYCRHACIVHEGPLDVWATGPGAVCTFGTGYSVAQETLIAGYLVRAVCFDNEPEAQRRARKLCDNLSVFPGDTFNVVLDSKDAASGSREEIARLRREVLCY